MRPLSRTSRFGGRDGAVSFAVQLCRRGPQRLSRSRHQIGTSRCSTTRSSGATPVARSVPARRRHNKSASCIRLGGRCGESSKRRISACRPCAPSSTRTTVVIAPQSNICNGSIPVLQGRALARAESGIATERMTETLERGRELVKTAKGRSALVLDRKKLAAFSAAAGRFLQFPIGDRRCNRTRASVGNAGGNARPSLTNATLTLCELVHTTVAKRHVFS